MTTLSNKFHELGNWHNKIGMGTIVTIEVLSDPNLLKLPPAELQEVIDKAVKTLGKFEGFVTGADKCVNEIKTFVYEKLGKDTQIVP